MNSDLQSKRKVEVVPYDSNWPKIFEAEASKIKQILGENCIEIHHIGSTSIPGLSAKPIIDIIPVVKNILAVDTCNASMQLFGYQVRGEYGMLFRRFFQKINTFPAYNIHVFELGNSEIDRHLRFRNYMKAHSEEKLTYDHLKKELAKAYPNDINAYCAGKDAFVLNIDSKSGYNGYRIVQALTNVEWEAYHRISKESLESLGFFSDPVHPVSSKNHCYFIFRKEVSIAGIAHIEFVDNASIILRSLIIDQPYRRQKLGSIFLSLIERWLQHQNQKMLYVYADSNSLDFFKNSGFSETIFNDTENPFWINFSKLGKNLFKVRD